MAIKKKGLGRGIDSIIPDYSSHKSAKGLSRSEQEFSQIEEGELKTETGSKRTKKQVSSGDTERKVQEQTAAEEKTNAVVMVKLSEIEPNKGQPRQKFEDDALQELAESIRQYGVLQPLVVQKREDFYEIIAGERRWRAARLAGLSEIPVLIKDFTDQEVLEVSLIENIQREDLNPVEEAKAYQRLLNEFSLKQDELAGRVAKSRSTITNSLRLLKLDERVQQMLIDEMISAGHARTLLGIEDKEIQYQTANRIFDEKLSVRDAEKLIKNINSGKEKKKKTSQSEALSYIYKDMEEKMREALGTKVKVNQKSEHKGQIEISYFSNEELERIFGLLKAITT